MSRYTLLIMFTVLTAIGGCSRCKDAPGPILNHNIQIYFIEYMKMDPYLKPLYTDSSTKRRVDTLFTDGAIYAKFQCSDTLWSIYEWHFGNGQTFHGKSPSIYFDTGDSDLIDDVTLTAYNKSRSDSTKATMHFSILYINKWQHFGRFHGRLWYIDHYIDNVNIDLALGKNASGSALGIQARGLYLAACGCQDTIRFQNVGINQAYQTGSDGSESAILDRIQRTDSCKFKYSSFWSTGHFYSFQEDSLTLSSVRYTAPKSDNPPKTVQFKGKRI